MLSKKRTILMIISVILVSFIIYIGAGVFEYLEFKKAAKAVATFPWVDGGKVTTVREPCILDTPATTPTTCAISCPLVTSVWGPSCVNYIEVDTTGYLGSQFIAVPKGFVFIGAGHPKPGMSFLAGGSGPAFPGVIGITSATALRTKKLVDWFDYIIAGFKE